MTSTRTTGLENITAGVRVILEDQRTGIVRFIGPVHFRAGVIAGVELDDPYVGDNDGSVNGWRYFDAPTGKALFVERASLTMIEDQQDDFFADALPMPNGPESIPMDDFADGSRFPNRETRRYPDGPAGTGTMRERTPSLDSLLTDDIDGTVGLGGEKDDDDDDKYKRWQRGMTQALEHEVFDYKSDPSETDVCVNYALKGLPYDEIVKPSKKQYKQCIIDALPADLKEKVNPREMKLTFEDLGDYTEMKVDYEAEDPEMADDMKWTMLDPIHVRKVNDNLKEKPSTDLVNAEYSYLERRRRQGDGCCKWVKPCLACICCWLLLLTLLLGLMFSKLESLAEDVEDLKAGGYGSVGYVNGSASCEDFDICEQIAKNRDDIDALIDNGGLGEFGVTELEIVKTPIDNTGAAVSTCQEGWEIISCWVYIPNHWLQYSTYVDPDALGTPDCSCFCQHNDDSYGCVKVAAECRAQCARFGKVVT